MIKFNPSKTKKLSFGYQAENIQPSNLEYYIRLTDGKIDYGIKGEQKGNELVFEIPPLNEFIEKNIDNLSTIKMEVNSKDNKYYLKPFEDSIEIEKEPEMNVEVNEEGEKEERSTFFVTEMKEEDEDNKDNTIEEEHTGEHSEEDDSLQEKESNVQSKEDIEKKKRERKNKQLFDYLNK